MWVGTGALAMPGRWISGMFNHEVREKSLEGSNIRVVSVVPKFWSRPRRPVPAVRVFVISTVPYCTDGWTPHQR
jgi:hypothetical protein